MATTVEQIDAWRALPRETTNLEFKKAENQFDNTKFFRYCVAIGNEGGGHLILGIANDPPRAVVGTKAFNNPAGMEEKTLDTLGFRVTVEEVAHPDGRVLVCHIPSRARGTAYHHEGAYWMRSGEQLVPMSEDKLRQIFAEGQPDWLEEAAVREQDAQQVVELLDVQTYFELLQLPFPSDRNGVIDRLKQDHLIEERHGSFSIKRLGALLLARRLSDFPVEIARKAARVEVYSGTSKVDTKLSQTGIRGYAVGFQGLVDFVMAQLPQNEVIEDALRTDAKLVPSIAVRELIANALIHQDFNLTGVSVMIEIYSNRVEISNPGDPVVPVDRFIDGYQSRNESLADLMRRLRICEEKSSGVDKVVNAAEFYQLPAPDFRVGHNRTCATIFGHRSFEEMDRSDRIRACYQHCVLRWVLNERMTNQTLRERFKLSSDKSATASQVISATIEAGKIKSDDSAGLSRKLARYIPWWA